MVRDTWGNMDVDREDCGCVRSLHGGYTTLVQGVSGKEYWLMEAHLSRQG